MSCAIATTILEDKAWVDKYTKKSKQVLAEHYALATRILDKAGIEYARDGFVSIFAPRSSILLYQTDP